MILIALPSLFFIKHQIPTRQNILDRRDGKPWSYLQLFKPHTSKRLRVESFIFHLTQWNPCFGLSEETQQLNIHLPLEASLHFIHSKTPASVLRFFWLTIFIKLPNFSTWASNLMRQLGLPIKWIYKRDIKNTFPKSVFSSILKQRKAHKPKPSKNPTCLSCTPTCNKMAVLCWLFIRLLMDSKSLLMDSSNSVCSFPSYNLLRDALGYPSRIKKFHSPKCTKFNITKKIA